MPKYNWKKYTEGSDVKKIREGIKHAYFTTKEKKQGHFNTTLKYVREIQRQVSLQMKSYKEKYTVQYRTDINGGTRLLSVAILRKDRSCLLLAELNHFGFTFFQNVQGNIWEF